MKTLHIVTRGQPFMTTKSESKLSQENNCHITCILPYLLSFLSCFVCDFILFSFLPYPSFHPDMLRYHTVIAACLLLDN